MVEIAKNALDMFWIDTRFWISKSALDMIWIDKKIWISKIFCLLSKYPNPLFMRLANYPGLLSKYPSRARVISWIKYIPKGIYILSNEISLDRSYLSRLSDKLQRFATTPFGVARCNLSAKKEIMGRAILCD